MSSGEELRRRLMTLGRIPVFPLPNVVLFPDTTLGLHIFEPRYRSMTEDALRSDRLIAMAVLKPGWGRDDQGNAEVYRTACAGVIESEARQPDGRYNIRLRGFARIEIDRFVQDHPYRIAAVRVLADRNDADGSRVEQDRKRLLSACTSLLQEVSGESSRPVAIDLDVPFAVVVNTLCHNLALEPDIKQRLLELDDVGIRCRALIDILEERWKEIALAREVGGAGPHEVH